MIKDKVKLKDAMELACDWLVNIAQVDTKQLTIEQNSKGFVYTNWKGAIRGEYRVATGRWDFGCPIWHTGQAVKALLQAYKLLNKDGLLEAARSGAAFIMRAQMQPPDPDAGLILAYENIDHCVNTSAILESLDGLLNMYEVTGEEQWLNSVRSAMKWIEQKAYIWEEGLFRDEYDVANKEFRKDPFSLKTSYPGRPLADDGMFLRGYYYTKRKSFRAIFYETVERLLKEEGPSGNWINFLPCDKQKKLIHPRQAYWWALPMVMAYRDSKDRRFLECAKRAGQWYMNAQRRDGGFFRKTYSDFNTESFWHATSGAACACILWFNLFQETGEKLWLEPLRQGLDFCMKMQFAEPDDHNLKGAILERLFPPDGTDRSPYHIRDVGTIFFIQAASLVISELE